MSLHRVSSMESWEQPNEELEGSNGNTQHRKMTFNPLPEQTAPATSLPEPTTPAETSQSLRILQIGIACIYCLLASGIVFGYAAFKQVLVREGIYREECPYRIPEISYQTCYEQELRLNLMFTIAAVVTNVAALPVGTILDRYGPRVSGILGSLFVALGSAFFIFAPQVPFDAYIPAYLFLALGGPFIYISSFQLSNCFPRHSGLILALLTGAFDTSSAIFLVYRLIYQASSETFTPQKFFSVYLIIPILLLVVQLTIMPASSYKTAGEIKIEVEASSTTNGPTTSPPAASAPPSESEPLLGRKDTNSSLLGEARKKRISRVWGALHGRSALHQIQTPWFILITLFVMLQMLRINYFVATIRPQYEHLLSSQCRAKQINDFFDVALPVGGVLSIPFIGLVLDNLSTPVTLGALVLVATAIGVLGCLPYAWAAYANVVLFVVYRPFYYTAVSDYAAKVFGFYTFGKVYGLIICLSGLFNLAQSALDALRYKAFGNDPVPVNMILLAAVFVVGTVLVGYVWRKAGGIEKEFLREEAEETTMPDVSRGRGNWEG